MYLGLGTSFSEQAPLSLIGTAIRFLKWKPIRRFTKFCLLQRPWDLTCRIQGINGLKAEKSIAFEVTDKFESMEIEYITKAYGRGPSKSEVKLDWRNKKADEPNWKPNAVQQ